MNNASSSLFSNSSPRSILNSSEATYLTLVQSYMNTSRDILNGYMTLENGLSNQIFRNLARTTAPRTAAPQPDEVEVEVEVDQDPVPNLETPVNLIRGRGEALVQPDTPIRPTLRFRSNLPSSLSPPPSSPFQMPTPVRLTSRLDGEEPPRFMLPRRIGSLSQLREPQTHHENSWPPPPSPPPSPPQPNQNVDVGVPPPTPPFASSFVRYRLPVAIGPPRRVVPLAVPLAVPLPVPLAVPLPVPDASDSATSANARPSEIEVPTVSPPQSPPSYTSRTWQELRRQQVQRQQEREQREREREREREQQRERATSLSPILPIVEPPPMTPLTTATRMMLNLLDTPSFNDSLVYYTQIINREIAGSRQGRGERLLDYDTIQQQTKIIPYCLITNPLNDICPISQIPFDLVDSVMQINICKHNFNPYSLIRWFNTNSTCPMCRRHINENDDSDVGNDGGNDGNGNGNDGGNDGNGNGNGRSNAIRMYNENNLYHDDSDFSSVG